MKCTHCPDTCRVTKESAKEGTERKEGRLAGMAEEFRLQGMQGLGMVTKAQALSNLS